MDKTNEKHEYRQEELAVLYFDKLPQRAKELYFEYMSYSFPSMHPESKAFCFGALGFDYDECKSPIEIIFNVAYDILRYDTLNHYAGLFLDAQRRIAANGNNYIADFYVDTSERDHYKFENNLRLVIECDGHDFHEKTKEQVKRGNERDYDLKIEGIEVLHFSGSEIFNAPFTCGVKALEFIENKVGKWEHK